MGFDKAINLIGIAISILPQNWVIGVAKFHTVLRRRRGIALGIGKDAL
jgi:hypothetical protein